MLHHILEDRIRDVADKQIMLRMPVRQKWSESIRVISYHDPTFVFLVTEVKIRVFSYQKQDFSYQDSCYQLPEDLLSL
ncbi:hypothetical protein NBRC116593_44180 [Sulfitobacter pacificus]